MTFNAVAATPTGTTIAYQYSTDGTTTPYKPTTGTSLTTQVAHLEQNGQTEAVDTLKQEHPEFFNGRASKQDVQVKIVSLLGEAVDKMRELVELRGK